MINNGRRFHNTELYYSFSIKCNRGGKLKAQGHKFVLMESQAGWFLKGGRIGVCTRAHSPLASPAVPARDDTARSLLRFHLKNKPINDIALFSWRAEKRSKVQLLSEHRPARQGAGKKIREFLMEIKCI